MLLKERREDAKRNFTQTLAKGQLFGYTENDEFLLGAYLNEIDTTLCQQNHLFVEEKARFTMEKFNTIRGHYMKMCDLRMATERQIDEQTVDNAHLKKWILRRSIENDSLIMNDRVINEKKRVWSEVTRDRLSKCFHFETQKEETIRLSMYHIFCQYQDITLVVMSHLFQPLPLYYTEIVEKYDDSKSRHKKGLRSTLALLCTCRYMYRVIGDYHYPDLMHDIKAKKLCYQCEGVKSKLCRECNTKFCGDCMTEPYRCDHCYDRYCESCLKHITMLICTICGSIFCHSCSDLNAIGVCGECRDENDSDDMDLPEY